MSRSFTSALSSGVLCAAALCVFCAPVSAQTPAQIETLARRTAERVAKTHQQHIFAAGLKECLLDAEICALFEASLRADMEKAVPGIRFVKRESVINILEGRGFIALDAYVPEVLKAVATSAGADILVTDTLQLEGDGYELTSEVFDAVQGKKLEQIRAKIARPAADSGGEPVVFKDAESGVSLIIPRGKQSHQPAVENPACAACPDPTYTPEARTDRIQGRVLLLVTVTEQGVAEHIGVIDGLADGLTDQALDTLHRWRFNPARGKDGKPLAVRVPIEMNFRLQ
jgi:TonB family protein